MWLLPQNPGPFGTLEQWKVWRGELRELGPTTVGVDFELAFAEKWISDLESESASGQVALSEMVAA
jgi:hypothetical protein